MIGLKSILRSSVHGTAEAAPFAQDETVVDSNYCEQIAKYYRGFTGIRSHVIYYYYNIIIIL